MRKITVTFVIWLISIAGPSNASSISNIPSDRYYGEAPAHQSVSAWPPWPFSSNTKWWHSLQHGAQKAKNSRLWSHSPPIVAPLLALRGSPKSVLMLSVAALFSWAFEQSLEDWDKEETEMLPFLPPQPENIRESHLEPTRGILGSVGWFRLNRRLRNHSQALSRRNDVWNQLTKREMQQPPTKDYFALITGASQGIGRAIAVECARRGIGLVLVARNVDRLQSLANDLQKCYGVECCILQADLSKPKAAERIYQATKELPIQILVNNAGLYDRDDESTLSTLTNALQVNTMAVAQLSFLFGRDMMGRGRGRIMMVSSVCGCVAGLPSMSVYAATKAFEKTLTYSMAPKLRENNIGMTCLIPGAVGGTNFVDQHSQALVWKVPGYVQSPETVARVGMRALMRGKTECIVGWPNWFFVKVLQPLLPPMFHNGIASLAFRPIGQGKRSIAVATPDTPFPEAIPLSTPQQQEGESQVMDFSNEDTVPSEKPFDNFEDEPEKEQTAIRSE